MPDAWTSPCYACSWPAGRKLSSGADIPVCRKCGLIEIALHPGEAAPASSERDADGWHDPLAARRPGELQMLVSPELPALPRVFRLPPRPVKSHNVAGTLRGAVNAIRNGL